MRRKRKSRKNAWFGKPRLHAKAARKGLRRRSRSSRKTRRNAGSMSATGLINNVTRSAKAGFDPKILKRASAILLGNISTTWYVDQIASRVPMIKSNPIFDIGSLLLLGGAQGVFASHFKALRPYATDLLIGGILAGVTRAVKTVLPGQFSTCGLGELGEDLNGLYDGDEGLGNFVISPESAAHAFHMNGLGAYPGPSLPTIGTHGMGDHAVLHASQAGHQLINEHGIPWRNGVPAVHVTHPAHPMHRAPMHRTPVHHQTHNPMVHAHMKGLADTALAEELAGSL